MNIEDLIDRLANAGNFIFDNSIKISKTDISIIHSLSEQIQRGNGYTEKQRTLAVRLVSTYATELSLELKYDITIDLSTPKFRYPIRVLTGHKSVEVKLMPTGEKKIVVQFPFNNELIELFKSYKKEIKASSDANWDSESRSWVFEFSEPNVLFLRNTLGSGFVFDQEFLEVALQIEEIKNNIEDYIPMIVYNDGKYHYKNTVSKIPQPSSTNLIEVLLDSRKYGITCWDDAIDLALKSDEIPQSVQLLVTSKSGTPVMLKNSQLSDIADILLYSNNVLFVIPGGTELLHLTTVHTYLKSRNVSDTDIAVLFRLDSSSGKVCNEYIKDHHLNNPISDQIKYTFISGKFPKPLIESGKRFDLVVYFGSNSAHFTLRNYVRNHHNVISMNLDNKNTELNFAQL